MKPLPAALVTVAVCTAAITLSNPLFPAAAAIAAGALLAAAGPPRRMYAAFAITTGLTVFAARAVRRRAGPDDALAAAPTSRSSTPRSRPRSWPTAPPPACASPPRPWRSGAFVRPDRLRPAAARRRPRRAAVGDDRVAHHADAPGPGARRGGRAGRRAHPSGAGLAARRRPPASWGRSSGCRWSGRWRSPRRWRRADTRARRGRLRPAARSRRANASSPASGPAALATVVAALVTGAGDFRYFDLLDDPWTAAAVAGSSALAVLGAAFAWVARCRP